MGGRVLPGEPGDPRVLGPYELLGRLGQGGMGVVYLGRERRRGRLAAVKALRQELAGDPAFADRFRREVEAARRVDAPSVARVLGADPSGPQPWLATEYVDGPTLAAAVAATGPLAEDHLVGFAAGVAGALAAIHAAGVVHRDLKPSNVLLASGAGPAAGSEAEAGPEARTRPAAGAWPTLSLGDPTAEPLPARWPGQVGVKVIDFGIASATDATLTRSGLRFGTPAWMAPEQLRDGPVGPAADVFAWGALVAFAATGRHPFGGGPADAVAYRILHDRPDLAGVPEPVRHLVQDALARDPGARPTAARLATTLAAALPPTVPLPATGPTRVLPAAIAGGSGPLPSGAHGAMAQGPTRRRRRRRVGGLLAAAALLAGLVTAPHMVLAAVEGPDDPAGQHASTHCPDDREDEEATAGEGHEDDGDDEEDEEEMDEVAKGRPVSTPPAGAGSDGEQPPAGAGQASPPPAPQPPTQQAPTGPRPQPGNQVPGS
jgi:hypothetical protein